MQTDAKIRRMSKYLEQRQEVPDVSKDSAVGALIDVEGVQYGQLFEGKTGKYLHFSILETSL